MQSYDVSGTSAGQQRSPANRAQLLASLEELRDYFQGVEIENLVGEGITEQNLIGALEAAGSNLDEFRRNSDRFQTVRMRLQDEGVEVVFDNDGPGQPELEVESESE
jgi:hypothetical protein